MQRVYMFSAFFTMGCCESSEPPPYSPLANEVITKEPLQDPPAIASELCRLTNEAHQKLVDKQYTLIIKQCYEYAGMGSSQYSSNLTSVYDKVIKRLKTDGIHS